VILPEIVAREIINDLLEGDAAKDQLIVYEKQVETLELKVTLKDSVIYNLDSQLVILDEIQKERNDQVKLAQELSEQLNKDLKKTKAKNFLLKISNVGVIIIAVVVTILTNGKWY